MLKKILLAFLAFVVLTLAGVYIFIPGKITIAKTIMLPANRDALFRKIESGASWQQWWPGSKTKDDTALSYSLNNMIFKPGAPRALSVPMYIETSAFETHSEFTFLSHNKDSTTIHLETSIPRSSNPLERVRRYLKKQQLENSFSEILRSINATYSTTANLYDYDILKKLVVDSILISTFEETKGYPSIDRIYQLIDRLKGHIKKNNADETGFPMLNIYTADSLNYLVKVALPVNKKLPGAGNISYKWMLGGGNILITEVKGGQEEINKAYKQIVNYIADHSLTAPAIPFESLVTDRRKEPDSSKWVTRIYYPVM